MIVSTEGIVLRSMKFGDSSKIISLYSLEEGMVSLIAKGARNPKSKFGSALQPLSIIYASFYKKSNRDLHIVNKAELIKPLSGISRSIEKMAVGLSLVESVSHTQEKDDANHELFYLLKDKLIKLNSIEIDPFTIFISFQIELAQLMGFGIDFSGLNTGKEKNTFYFPSGSFLKENAYDLDNSFVLNKISADIINNIINKKSQIFQGMEIRFEVINEIAGFFSRYFSFHTDKNIYFNSLNLLNNAIEY